MYLSNIWKPPILAGFGKQKSLNRRWFAPPVSRVSQHPKHWRFLSSLQIGKLYAVF